MLCVFFSSDINIICLAATCTVLHVTSDL